MLRGFAFLDKIACFQIPCSVLDSQSPLSCHQYYKVKQILSFYFPTSFILWYAPYVCNLQPMYRSGFCSEFSTKYLLMVYSPFQAQYIPLISVRNSHLIQSLPPRILSLLLHLQFSGGWNLALLYAVSSIGRIIKLSALKS